MKHTRLLSLVLIVLCLAFLPGCDKKKNKSRAEPSADTASNTPAPLESTDENPQESSNTTSSPEGVLVKDVLALWEAGQKDEAVTQFVSIQWDDPSVFKEMKVLTMSEQEYLALPRDEMKPVVEEAMNLLGKLRKLMFDVVAEGEKLAASGDANAAKEHFTAVRRYGQALSQPERLEVIQMHGKAAIGYADKKQAAITER
jgi:hypothetical protein